MEGEIIIGANLAQTLENVGTAFAIMIIIALIVERSLSVIFNYKFYKAKLAGRGFKVPITLGVCLLICFGYPFDAMAIIFTSKVTVLGQLITAGFLAGGSKRIAETFGDLKHAVEEMK